MVTTQPKQGCQGSSTGGSRGVDGAPSSSRAVGVAGEACSSPRAAERQGLCEETPVARGGQHSH
eukprot:2627390-Prorocentrum_lima.AAC.1